MQRLLTALLLLPSPLLAAAQFGQFFEHMFGGTGGASGGGGGARQQNVASDSSWYRQNYEAATCSNYLCPGTLACVDKPTHCPCAFPEFEEKFELHPDSLAICVSKSARPKATARKVELARKGML
ncbi:Long chronological lifespan protein 2 [Rhizina undulata]